MASTLWPLKHQHYQPLHQTQLLANSLHYCDQRCQTKNVVTEFFDLFPSSFFWENTGLELVQWIKTKFQMRKVKMQKCIIFSKGGMLLMSAFPLLSPYIEVYVKWNEY